MPKPDLPPPAASNIHPFPRSPDDPIFKGSDGGGSDMLAARVGQLEEDVKDLRSDMKIVRSDLSELKGKVSMLPGYGGIALIVGLIVGLSTLAQFLARFAGQP